MNDPADLRHRPLSDADVLSAFAERAGGPAFASELAQRLGLPEEEVPVRLASLVSLGYLEAVAARKQTGYAITERGLAEAARAARPGEGAGGGAADRLLAFLA